MEKSRAYGSFSPQLRLRREKYQGLDLTLTLTLRDGKGLCSSKYLEKKSRTPAAIIGRANALEEELNQFCAMTQDQGLLGTMPLVSEAFLSSITHSRDESKTKLKRVPSNSCSRFFAT